MRLETASLTSLGQSLVHFDYSTGKFSGGIKGNVERGMSEERE